MAGLAVLGTTFAYVDEHGASYTVQCEEQDARSATAFTRADGTIYYDVELTLHEA